MAIDELTSLHLPFYFNELTAPSPTFLTLFSLRVRLTVIKYGIKSNKGQDERQSSVTYVHLMGRSNIHDLFVSNSVTLPYESRLPWSVNRDTFGDR